MTTNKTNRTALRLAVAALAVLLLCGAAFAGAAGAEPQYVEDPLVDVFHDDWTHSIEVVSGPAYLISNEEDWLAVVNNISMWDKTLVLANDIVFTAPVRSIGNASTPSAARAPFTGRIYGNGAKIINFTQTTALGNDAHGLIYIAGDGCVLNYVQMIYCKIESGSNFVGGLVGYATPANTNGVHLCGCSVMFSSVTTSGCQAGGLIGATEISKVWVNACLVDCAYVRTATGGTGGLIGYAAHGSNLQITDSRVNGSELRTGGVEIGGVISSVYGKDSTSYAYLTNLSVTDCKIVSSSTQVAGLVGTANGWGVVEINGCLVNHCTIQSSSNGVGGLVGMQLDRSERLTFTGGTSRVMNTWVSGSSDIGAVLGVKYGGSTSGTASTQNVWGSRSASGAISNNGFSAYPKSLDQAKTPIPASPEIYYCSAIDKYGLTAGKDYGYPGYYAVLPSPASNGTVSVTPWHGLSGTEITITSISADPGYKQDGLPYWTTPGDSTKHTISNGKFILPSSNVIVSADFRSTIHHAEFSIDTENLSCVWNSADPKLYWTTEDSDIEIPVSVHNTDNGKYLYAYKVNLRGNITDTAGTNKTIENIVESWTGQSFAENGWQFVKTADDALTSEKIDINESIVPIFRLSIPANTFTEGYYNLTADGELGVTFVENPVTYNDVELSTADSSGFPADDGQFIIYVRNATEDIPETTAYEPRDAPDNYPTLISGNPGDTFYYFTERLDGQDKRVYLTAVTNPAYDNLFDTNNWNISGVVGDMFNGTFAAESVTAVGGKLKNSVVVNGTALGTAKITLTLNEGRTGVENITCFTFSAEPWNKSLVTNDNPVRAAGYAKDSLNWSFATPLIYNYTVSAGPVNTTVGDGWNTHVKLGNETYGNTTSGTAVPVVWNGTVSYNATDGTFGLKNESGKITSDTNFTVVQNTIADGTQRVLVTLTGFKLGDANIDDKVNIADSAVVGITVLKGDSAAEAITFLPYENRLYADCDASRSGTIDVADILAINRFIVGLDPWAAA